MEEFIKISCIIPTCNRPEFLKMAIHSVLCQTFLPLEIIIVNNGDNQVKLGEEYNTQKIKVVDIKAHCGASVARNFGAKKAQGGYLAFLDDDDRWNKSYLEKMIAAISQGAECVFSRMDYIGNDKVKLFKNPDSSINIKNLLTFNPGVSGSNLVIKKDLFFKVGGYDEKLKTSEDKALAIELLKLKAKIICLPENQVIINYNSSGLRNAASLAEGIYQFTKKYKKLMSFKQYFYNWYKIYYYRRKAGVKSAFLPYIFLTLFFAPKRLCLTK